MEIDNLYNFVTMVLPKLTMELPRPFKMVGLERDDDTPQHKAIREAMTNCIIHADLMLNSVLKVEKYDDKFVFTNPGLLKLPVEQIYAGEETRARNQRIQNMFRMIGFGENLGSGFPLILSAWNEKHWLKPELIEQRELMQENGDKLGADKANVEAAVQQLKDAHKSGNVAAIDTAINNLNQVMQAASQKMYAQAGPQPGAEQAQQQYQGGQQTSGSNPQDDIQDADFEEVK